MSKGNTSSSALTPLFEKVAELSKPQRIGIYIGVLCGILLLFGYLLLWPKMGTIDQMNKRLVHVQGELNKAKRNAAQLNEWRSKMRKKETEYKTVMQALPEKEEIPSLLAGISQAGKDAGLEFLLFQPKHEVRKGFYAEIPVDINVSGPYHQVAVFFEKVSNLPRIVNIRNIKIAPQSKDKSRALITSCQAVTYKFIESGGKKNHKKRSRRR